MVPTIPKKVIIPKFSKNKDFLKLYPAEKIIGGNIIVKKISPENCKLSPKVFIEIQLHILQIWQPELPSQWLQLTHANKEPIL